MSEVTERDATQTAIMDATYHALCEHGYANLTMAKIASEFEKSKSLLYYHYENKDELLVAFLDYMLDRFSEDASIESSSDPETELRSFLDKLLPPELDDERRRFHVALFELRSEAPHDEAYRDHFAKVEVFMRERLADVIRTGVENGTFRDVDPEQTAAMFVSTIHGAMLHRVTGDGEASTEDVRAALDDYIETRLSAEER